MYKCNQTINSQAGYRCVGLKESFLLFCKDIAIKIIKVCRKQSLKFFRNHLYLSFIHLPCFQYISVVTSLFSQKSLSTSTSKKSGAKRSRRLFYVFFWKNRSDTEQYGAIRSRQIKNAFFLGDFQNTPIYSVLLRIYGDVVDKESHCSAKLCFTFDIWWST